jgi:hypothetical protein
MAFPSLVRVEGFALSAKPTLPLDVDKREQGAKEGKYDRIDKSMLPRELWHHCEIHAVESGYECWRKKDGGDDCEDLNDLILLDVEDVCYRARK